MKTHNRVILSAALLVLLAPSLAWADANLMDVVCEPCEVIGGQPFNLILKFDRAEFAQPMVMSNNQSVIPFHAPVPNNSASTFYKQLSTKPVSQQTTVRITTSWGGRENLTFVTVKPAGSQVPPVRVKPTPKAQRERHWVPAALAVSHANRNGFETTEVQVFNSGIKGLTLAGGCTTKRWGDRIRILREGTRGCGYTFFDGKGHLNPGWKLTKVAATCLVTSAVKTIPPLNQDGGVIRMSFVFQQSLPGDYSDTHLDGFYHECYLDGIELEGPALDPWQWAFK